MNSGVGLGTGGKKQNTQTKVRNNIEATLIANPYFPRLKRRLISGSSFHRLTQTQEMDTMYEESRALTPSEVILLYAVRLPMLIKDNKVEMSSVTITDRMGISHFSGT
jgi:hypothetical protein